MKKILFTLILFLITGVVIAQNANIMSASNSYIVDATHPLLDSAEVSTGGAQSLIGYNSLSVTIRADKNGYLKILFGNTITITTATAVKTYVFNYTANDTTFTKYVSTDAPYYKVVYQNDSTAATGARQTKFYLITMLNRGEVLPRDSNGDVKVASVGGATAANQLGTGSKGYDKITSIGGDSVAAATLGFTSYWKVTVAAVDDTIKFSTSYNYPAIDLRILKPGESYTTTWPLAVANVPKFYFATSGVGTPKAKIFAEGR